MLARSTDIEDFLALRDGQELELAGRVVEFLQVLESLSTYEGTTFTRRHAAEAAVFGGLIGAGPGIGVALREIVLDLLEQEAVARRRH